MRKVKALLLFAVSVLMISILTGCGSTTINLDKYIIIETYGYDTLGAAAYTFDFDAFHEDYSGKIKVNSENRDKITELGLRSEMTTDELLLDICVSQQLDRTSRLSNGDTITLIWDCKDDLASEYFNCELIYSDIEYTVKDLKEIGAFDPFDYLEVSFSGTAPHGNVIFTPDKEKDEMKYITFSTDSHGGLSNGDSVVVKASLSVSEENFAAQFGTLPSETEKSYEVNSLAYYVKDSAEISSDMMEKMVSQGLDVFNAYVAEQWSKPDNLVNVSPVGNYLLYLKDGMNGDHNNYLFLVYNVTAVNPEPEETINFYYYIYYTDIIAMEDGACSIDMSSYHTPNSMFNVGDYRYVGDSDLNSLFNSCVVSRIDSYEYVSTVQ